MIPESQMTPEFGPGVKPVRVGVYRTIFFDLVTGYSYWDGKRWSDTENTVEQAFAIRRRIGSQMKRWRGLAEQPK